MTTSPRIDFSDIGLLIARLLLAFIFLHEGVALAADFGSTIKALATMGVGVPLALATIALQIAAGTSVAFGLLTRVGALLLGVFCVATAVLFHTNFASHNELLHFEKDLAIAGGMFALAIAGAGAISLDKAIARKRWTYGHAARILFPGDRDPNQHVPGAS